MKPPDRRSWTSLLGEVKPERAVVHRLCRQVEEPRFALKSCFSRRVERCEQISQYRPRQRPNPECFALPPGLIGRSWGEASPFAKSGGDHCGWGLISPARTWSSRSGRRRSSRRNAAAADVPVGRKPLISPSVLSRFLVVPGGGGFGDRRRGSCGSKRPSLAAGESVAHGLSRAAPSGVGRPATGRPVSIFLATAFRVATAWPSA